MDTGFFATSIEVANGFLQNILFIDDKAFDSSEEKGNHDFDAYTVTKSFAESKKICAVYKPKTMADIDLLAELAKRADITVLDWQIHLTPDAVPVGSEEEDADNEDPRGPHTLKIVREILSDSHTGKGSLKLIIIYTGDIALHDIRDDIYNDLLDQGITISKSDFEVTTGNIKILIVAKPDNEFDENGKPKSKFTHVPEFNERVKSYQELPDFIIEEFTKMTSGLLSNFVLKSLTVLRSNTFKLISLYDKELDQAFLSHRLLLPSQEDSKEQLVNIFADSVEALLHYSQTGDSVSIEDIKKWVDTREYKKEIKIGNKSITINGPFIKTWAEQGFNKAIAEQWNEALDDAQEKMAKKKMDELAGHPSLLTDATSVGNDDIAFSVLTHHKSIFKPNSVEPKLTLGAVVKGSKSGYWVCIQQRCDSVRLSGIRRFLFLPLKEVAEEAKGTNFNFVTTDGKKLKLSTRSFELRTIKFSVNVGEDFIKATPTDGKFFFEPLYKNGHLDYLADKDETYEWVLDLKELHAQRIAHSYAMQLSRVGLDESEWLRRKSGN